MRSIVQPVLLLLVAGFWSGVTAQTTQQWAGYISYPPYIAFGALNATVKGNVATFSWVYDVDSAGRKCFPDTETGLQWSIVGTTVEARGTGKDPSYYSFNGTYMPKGNSINGFILDHTGKALGTIGLVLDAPQVASRCGEPPQWSIWPLPADVSYGTQNVTVVPSPTFFSSPQSSSFLSQAFARYLPITFPHSAASGGQGSAGPSATSITSLVVTVDSVDDSYPQLGINESYTLAISPGSSTAKLHAATVYGALHGLETFSQLVRFDFNSETYVVTHCPVTVQDEPRFPHRGLMVDTARHFEPVASLKSIIDSLPFAKINTLHWHMSDSQSFPLQSKSHPDLWKGSFSLQERYLQTDVTEVIDYAHARGIRVFVEFDVPGHADSWCVGYPEVCPSPTCLTPLNVANNETFTLIQDLLMEMTGGVPSKPGKPSPGLFKDNFIHLGGDEVNTACWSTTPSVANWLKDHNMTADQGYAYFAKTVEDMAVAQGHRPVQWSEVFDHFKDKLDKSTIVHIWKPVTNVTEVVAYGYNVLINVGYVPLSWYLDNLQVMWDAVYQNEPCAGVPDDLCHLVLGGQGEMWGETVDTSDLEQTVWPRLAAIAERLWSPRSTTNLYTAHTRLEQFRCLLNQRGVKAAPVNNAMARESPPHPGSCYVQ